VVLWRQKLWELIGTSGVGITAGFHLVLSHIRRLFIFGLSGDKRNFVALLILSAAK
jgi:hypothetical protein